MPLGASVLKFVLLAATVVTAASVRSDQLFYEYVADETARIERAANRTPVDRSLPAIHAGPGIHEDFEPLFTREGRKSLGKKRCLLLERRFKEIFRLDIKTFLHVMTRCAWSFRTRSNGQNPTSVAMCALYYLATGSTYAGVAAVMRNGMAVSTVMRNIRTFTGAVTNHLSGVVRFPVSTAALQLCAKTMEKRSGIPGIIGALDGSHIGVHPPAGQKAGYINYRRETTIILSAVVDPRGFFMCVSSGFPGKTHDAGALQQTPLWTEHGEWFSKAGYCIYGDAAYPLKDWLLTGFRHRKKTDDEIKFNRQGSRARVIIECAFGKLKGQWRVLMRGLETQTHEDWNSCINTCCILHNLTITMGGQGWKFGDSFHSGIPHRDAGDASFRTDPGSVQFSPGQGRDSSTAKEWRNGLMADLKAKRVI